VAVLTQQAAAMGGGEKEKALMEVFQMLDRNGSGSVELKELHMLLNKLLNRNIDEMTMGEIMAEITDSDQAGAELDFAMLCKVMKPVLEEPPEQLDERAFKCLDKDGSGRISTEELKPLMSVAAGEALTNEQTRDILRFSGGDDGKISLADFRRVTSSK